MGGRISPDTPLPSLDLLLVPMNQDSLDQLKINMLKPIYNSTRFDIALSVSYNIACCLQEFIIIENVIKTSTNI